MFATHDEAPAPSIRRARLALGLAVLAFERLRPGAPGALATGVGLLQQTAVRARLFARRAVDSPARMAFRNLGWASGLSIEVATPRPVLHSREWFGRVVADARLRGHATVVAGRADVAALIPASEALDPDRRWRGSTVRHREQVVDDEPGHRLSRLSGRASDVGRQDNVRKP